MVGVIARLPSDIHIAEKLKIARITARNAGIYEIIRRNGSDDEIVLADEGSLHIAHYLFVHVSVTPDLSDLDTFIHFVSLPDLIIYLRQPETVLIARTKARGHKRIPTNATNMVNQFIQHSQVVFEKLIQHSRIKSRLLIMNGDDEFKGFHIHLGHDLREFVRRIKDIGSAPRDKENLRTNPFDFGRNAGQE